MTKSTERQLKSVDAPLNEETLGWAWGIANKISGRKSEVYLNLLSVVHWNNYLNTHQIQTDLAASNSMNPGLHAIFDEGSLNLAKRGSFECVAVRSGETYVSLDNRHVGADAIAILVSLFEDNLHQPIHLGFLPIEKECPQKVYLSDLKSCIELIPYIREHAVSENDVMEADSPANFIVRIQDWLVGMFTAGWTESENRTSQQHLSFATMCCNQATLDDEIVSRERLLKLKDTIVKIKASVTIENEGESRFLLEAFSNRAISNERGFLPEGLKLFVLNSEGKVLKQAQTQTLQESTYIDFLFYKDETFTFEISLGNDAKQFVVES